MVEFCQQPAFGLVSSEEAKLANIRNFVNRPFGLVSNEGGEADKYRDFVNQPLGPRPAREAKLTNGGIFVEQRS